MVRAINLLYLTFCFIVIPSYCCSNRIFKKFSIIHWSFDPKDNIDVLYIRIIGNDLPPRHAAGQTLSNIQFSLQNEADFSPLGVKKFWIINRIFDNKKLEKIKDMLDTYNQSYGIIPFRYDEYKAYPFDAQRFPIPDFVHSPLFFQMSSALRENALIHIYHSKNLYAIHNNGGRNIGIELGKSVNAKWTMVFDGNCFMSNTSLYHLYEELMDNWSAFNSSASYFLVPMYRMLNYTIFFDETKISSISPSSALDEPQIIFRIDSQLTFNSNFRYGRRPKLDLLWRLGYPRNNTFLNIAPWEDPNIYGYKQKYPVLYQLSRHSWVARLFSGNSNQELSSTASGRLRSINRTKGIHSFINSISHTYVQSILASRRLPLLIDQAALKFLRKRFLEKNSSGALYDYDGSFHRHHHPRFLWAKKPDILDQILLKGQKIIHSYIPSFKLSRLLLADDECQYKFQNALEASTIEKPYSLSISAAILALNYHIRRDSVYREAALNITNRLLEINSLGHLSGECLKCINFSRIPTNTFGAFAPQSIIGYWDKHPSCSYFQMKMLRIVCTVPLYLLFDTLALLGEPINKKVALVIALWMKHSKRALGIASKHDISAISDIHSPYSPLPVWIDLPLRRDKNLVYDMNLLASIYYSGEETGSLEVLAYFVKSRFEKGVENREKTSMLPSFPIQLGCEPHRSAVNYTMANQLKDFICYQNLRSCLPKIHTPARKFAPKSPHCRDSALTARDFDFPSGYKNNETDEDLALYLHENGTITCNDPVFTGYLLGACGARDPWFITKSTVTRSLQLHGIMLITMLERIFPGILSSVKMELCQKQQYFCKDVETLQFLVY